MGIFSHWFEFDDDDEPCKDCLGETKRKEVSKEKFYHCFFCGNDAPDYVGCPTFDNNFSIENLKKCFELLKLEVPKDLKEKPFICENCLRKVFFNAMVKEVIIKDKRRT